MKNELVFGERRYRRIGETMVGQMCKPVLTGIWEFSWRHVGFHRVQNWGICRVLDTGVDPWLHGFAPNTACTGLAETSRQIEVTQPDLFSVTEAAPTPAANQ